MQSSSGVSTNPFIKAVGAVNSLTVRRSAPERRDERADYNLDRLGHQLCDLADPPDVSTRSASVNPTSRLSPVLHIVAVEQHRVSAAGQAPSITVLAISGSSRSSARCGPPNQTLCRVRPAPNRCPSSRSADWGYSQPRSRPRHPPRARRGDRQYSRSGNARTRAGSCVESGGCTRNERRSIPSTGRPRFRCILRGS